MDPFFNLTDLLSEADSKGRLAVSDVSTTDVVVDPLTDLRADIFDEFINEQDSLEESASDTDDIMDRIILQVVKARDAFSGESGRSIAAARLSFVASGTALFALNIMGVSLGAVGILVLIKWPKTNHIARMFNCAFSIEGLVLISSLAVAGILFIPAYLISDVCALLRAFIEEPDLFVGEDSVLSQSVGQDEAKTIAEITDSCLKVPDKRVGSALGLGAFDGIQSNIDFGQLDLEVLDNLPFESFTQFVFFVEVLDESDFGIPTVGELVAECCTREGLCSETLLAECDYATSFLTANATVTTTVASLKANSSLSVKEVGDLEEEIKKLNDKLEEAKDLMDPIYDALATIDTGSNCSFARRDYLALEYGLCTATLRPLLWTATALMSAGIAAISISAVLLVLGRLSTNARGGQSPAEPHGGIRSDELPTEGKAGPTQPLAC